MEGFKEKLTDSSQKYTDTTTKLSDNFDHLIIELDKKRELAYLKTKGLFKRAFFRVWIVSVILFIGATILVNGRIEPPMIIGSILFSAVVGLLFGGIYTLLKKAMNITKFTRVFKNELVAKIVKEVNPNFNFSKAGIGSAVFDESELFNGSGMLSEDTITGIIEEKPVIISQCERKTRHSNTHRHNKNTKPSALKTYFNGVFVKLELSNINLSSPLKIISKRLVDSNFRKHTTLLKLDRDRYIFKKINIEEDDRITLPSSINHSEYEFFSKNKEEAVSFASPNMVKVLDYIFDRYKKDDITTFSSIPILGNIQLNSGVSMSIIGKNLYLCLDWNKDMFESSMFLKKSLQESGAAHQVYHDFMFINQMVTELSLIDKINNA